jgi:hypothetical protein
MVLVYAIGVQPVRRAERMQTTGQKQPCFKSLACEMARQSHREKERFSGPFEEAKIGARKRQENQDRALTTDPGQV